MIFKNFRSTFAIVASLLMLMLVSGCGDKATPEQATKSATDWLKLHTYMYNATIGDTVLDIDNNGFTFKNVTLTPKEQLADRSPLGQATIKIDEINLTGMDADTYLGKPGDITTIKEYSARNTSVILDGAPVVTIEKVLIAGEKTPFKENLALIAQFDATSDLTPELLGKALDAAQKATADRIVFDKINAEFLPIFKVGIDKVDVKDWSIASIGASSLQNMDVSVFGAKVFSMASLSADSVALPADYMNMLQASMGISSADSLQDKSIFQLLDKMAIKNLKFSDVKVKVPGEDTSYSLKELTANASVANNEIKIDTNASSLIIPFANWSKGYQLRSFAQEFNKDFDISGAYNISFKPTNNNLISVIFNGTTSDVNLGALTVKGDAVGTARNIEKSKFERLIYNSAELTIDNKGLLDLLTATERVPGNAQERATLAAQEISEGINKNTMSQSAKDVLTNFQKVLVDGGSFTIIFAPETPSSLDDLNPEELNGVSSTYLAPTTPFRK